jgi:hypothetical protein
LRPIIGIPAGSVPTASQAALSKDRALQAGDELKFDVPHRHNEFSYKQRDLTTFDDVCPYFPPSWRENATGMPIERPSEDERLSQEITDSKPVPVNQIVLSRIKPDAVDDAQDR